jgi:hypothetical protein
VFSGKTAQADSPREYQRRNKNTSQEELND